jgi:hypothetical protein
MEAGDAARPFVRPLAMLAIGAAAGVAMWAVLMADDGGGLMQRSGGDRPGVLRAVLDRLALLRR